MTMINSIEAGHRKREKWVSDCSHIDLLLYLTNKQTPLVVWLLTICLSMQGMLV